jgi:FAD/FMN-containing dehydrogenase
VRAVVAAEKRLTRREWLCWSAVGAAPLIQAGCACADQQCAPRAPAALPASGEWQNAPATVHVKPALLALPRTAGELIEQVKAAAAVGKRVRMTGSGHSSSDAAVTADHLLLPTGLTRVLELSELRAEAQADHHLVRVQAGITLHELNCKLADQHLALENLGGYDAQTLSGVMMTATHGSGLAFGPIASQVVSLQMVIAGGELVQIEPALGITDRRTGSPCAPSSTETGPSTARSAIGWASRLSLG